MKKSIFLLFGFLVSFQIHSQVSFEKFYDHSHSDDGKFVSQLYDNGYIVIGETLIPTDTSRIYLIRTNEYGDTLWTKIFGDLEGSGFYSAAITADSGFIICAYNFINTFPSYFETLLIKTDGNGDTIWTKKYNDGFSGNSIQQTFDGGFIAVGNSTVGLGIELRKFNGQGDAEWVRTYTFMHSTFPNFLIQTADSGFAVAGSMRISGSSPGDDSTMAFLMKFDESGNQDWLKHFAYTQEMSFDCVRQTYDAGFIASGTIAYSGSSDDYYLLRTDFLGDTLWTKTYGDLNYESAVHLSICSDNGFIIAVDYEDTFDGNVIIVKTDMFGDTLWTRFMSYTFGRWIEQTSDNGYVMTGQKFDLMFNSDVYLLKLDSAGNLTTDITYLENPNDIVIYPNPSSGKIYLDLNHGYSGILNIYDLNGRLFKEYELTGQSTIELDFQNMTSGVYFVAINDGERVFVRKVVIN